MSQVYYVINVKIMIHRPITISLLIAKEKKSVWDEIYVTEMYVSAEF